MIKPDTIIRSSRKTLSVSIDCFGKVTVRAPRRCPEERIFAFLAEKEGWISRKRAERTGTGMCLPPENLDGYSFSLLGRACTIRLTDEARIRFDEETYVLSLPRKNARERLIPWLKENAKRIFTSRTERWAAVMHAKYRAVVLSSARGRWGSCSADDTIRFTFRLLYADLDLIDYVVVHELAHTKHKNHSPRFWAEVEKYLPDAKARRKRLQANGVFMHIF